MLVCDSNMLNQKTGNRGRSRPVSVVAAVLRRTAKRRRRRRLLAKRSREGPRNEDNSAFWPAGRLAGRRPSRETRQASRGCSRRRHSSVPPARFASHGSAPAHAVATARFRALSRLSELREATSSRFPPNGACYHGAEGEGLCARRPMDEEGDETAPPAPQSRTAASCPGSSSVCGAATRRKSNRESGYGRCDVMLVPRDPGANPGVVIELVVAGVPRKTCASTASLSRGSACSLGSERRRGSGWACPGRRTSGRAAAPSGRRGARPGQKGPMSSPLRACRAGSGQ